MPNWREGSSPFMDILLGKVCKMKSFKIDDIVTIRGKSQNWK